LNENIQECSKEELHTNSPDRETVDIEVDTNHNQNVDDTVNAPDVSENETHNSSLESNLSTVKLNEDTQKKSIGEETDIQINSVDRTTIKTEDVEVFKNHNISTEAVESIDKDKEPNNIKGCIQEDEQMEEEENECAINFTPTKPSTRSSLIKIDYKRSLDPTFDKTDINNPYKKTYLSYGNRCRNKPLKGTHLHSTLLPKDIKSTRKVQSAIVAKNLLEKAHNTRKKHHKLVSPLKITIKAESQTSRPRRQSKSNFMHSDFVYEIKRYRMTREVKDVDKFVDNVQMKEDLKGPEFKDSSNLNSQLIEETTDIKNEFSENLENKDLTDIPINIKLEKKYEVKEKRRRKKKQLSSDFVYEVKRPQKRKRDHLKIEQETPPIESITISKINSSENVMEQSYNDTTCKPQDLTITEGSELMSDRFDTSNSTIDDLPGMYTYVYPVFYPIIFLYCLFDMGGGGAKLKITKCLKRYELKLYLNKLYMLYTS